MQTLNGNDLKWSSSTDMTIVELLETLLQIDLGGEVDSQSQHKIDEIKGFNDDELTNALINWATWPVA